MAKAVRTGARGGTKTKAASAGKAAATARTIKAAATKPVHAKLADIRRVVRTALRERQEQDRR